MQELGSLQLRIGKSSGLFAIEMDAHNFIHQRVIGEDPRLIGLFDGLNLLPHVANLILADILELLSHLVDLSREGLDIAGTC